MIAIFRNPSGSRNDVSASAKARRDSNGAAPEIVPASGLYVDVENLQTHGQRVVRALADDWPSAAPPLKALSLYVRADTTELWRAWATSAFPNLDVAVRGVQHFSQSISKNSADMAIVANAMADWLLGRISHVAVISDDSDFISLYAAMRQERERQGETGTDVPFLWIITDRQKTVSETALQFFPPDRLHVVSVSGPDQEKPVRAPDPAPVKLSGYPTMEEIAKAIVEQMPVGTFKSTDCQPIIRRLWSDHPLATANSSSYGIEFKNDIWPVLEKLGVRIPNPNSQPVRYEMTQAAKARIQR